MATRQAEPEEGLVSPLELAERWKMSRSGAARLAERHGIRSVFLGGVARGTRRFLLADVRKFEQAATEVQRR